MRNGLVYFLTLCCLMLNCSMPSGPNGGGTRTGNPVTISGKLIDEQNQPVAGAKVTLRPADYLCPSPEEPVSQPQKYTVISDKAGFFRIDSVEPGRYVVEFNDQAGYASLKNRTVFENDHIINLGEEILLPYATVKIKINDLPPNTQLYARIMGTEHIAPVTADSCFIFDNLPSGTLVFHISGSNSTDTVEYRSSASVNAGATQEMVISGWSYAASIYLNTSSSGATVLHDVLRFPLLLRLDQSKIDFSSAQETDLWVSKSDGIPLACQIEKWDSAAQSVDVWVLMDTVYGNSTDQSIVLHWGNPNAVPDMASIVFDTADGFLGVWHLASNTLDASVSNADGGGTGISDTTGIIGEAYYFNGNSQIEVPGLMGKPSVLTLSAWVNLDSADGNGSEVISLGDAVVLRMDDTLVDFGTQGSYCFDSVLFASTRHDEVFSGRFLEKTGWHYVVYVVDPANSEQLLYIDGELAASKHNYTPLTYSHLGVNTFIGRHGNGYSGYSFTGIIDEVRISGVNRSADWVKLCFMNQKRNDQLVVFK